MSNILRSLSVFGSQEERKKKICKQTQRHKYTIAQYNDVQLHLRRQEDPCALVTRHDERAPTSSSRHGIFVGPNIAGSIRADTFNTAIEICLPMTMRTARPGSDYEEAMGCVGERWNGAAVASRLV